MAKSDDYRKILVQLIKINNRLCVIEGNQRNAESGTTACSAAGGGIEQVKTARSAGRAPCENEVLDVIRTEFEKASSGFDVSDPNRDLLFHLYVTICHQVAECFIEARR